MIYEERKPPSTCEAIVERVLAVMDKKNKFDSILGGIFSRFALNGSLKKNRT